VNHLPRIASNRSSPAEAQRRGEIQDQSGHSFHPLDPCEFLPSVLIFPFSLQPLAFSLGHQSVSAFSLSLSAFLYFRFSSIPFIPLAGPAVATHPLDPCESPLTQAVTLKKKAGPC
jgi:hypothetical protein